MPYDQASRYFVTDAEKAERVYPTLIPNWDHTPRTGRKGLVLHGSDPEKFESHLKETLDLVSHKSPEHRIIFVKSWNEWAEGNYLEPDRKFGNGYLESVGRNVLKNKEK